MDTLGNFIKTLVRPVVTVGLGAAVTERLVQGDIEGAKFLGTFFGIAMTFWFVDRAAGGTDNTPTTAADTAIAPLPVPYQSVYHNITTTTRADGTAETTHSQSFTAPAGTIQSDNGGATL